MAKVRIIIGLILLIGLAFLYLPGYSKIQELKERDRLLLKKIDTLEGENKNLSEELDKLKNDPVYIEYIARKEMGYVKEGEVIYKLIEEEPKTDQRP